MGVGCGRVWPGGVGERAGSGGVGGIVVREVIGHMLAAAVARGDWSGASGGVGPAVHTFTFKLICPFGKTHHLRSR